MLCTAYSGDQAQEEGKGENALATSATHGGVGANQARVSANQTRGCAGGRTGGGMQHPRSGAGRGGLW